MSSRLRPKSRRGASRRRRGPSSQSRGAGAPNGAGSGSSNDLPSLPSAGPSQSSPAQGSMISATSYIPEDVQMDSGQKEMQSATAARNRRRVAGQINSLQTLQAVAPSSRKERWMMVLESVPPAYRQQVDVFTIQCMDHEDHVQAAEDLAEGLLLLGRARTIASPERIEEVSRRMAALLGTRPNENAQAALKQCAELMLALKSLSGNREDFNPDYYAAIQDCLQYYTIDASGSVVKVENVSLDESVDAINQTAPPDTAGGFVPSTQSEMSPSISVVPGTTAPPSIPVPPPVQVTPITHSTSDAPSFIATEADGAGAPSGAGDTPAYMQEEEVESYEPPSFADQIADPSSVAMQESLPYEEEVFLPASTPALAPAPESEMEKFMKNPLKHPYAKYVGIGALVLGGAYLFRNTGRM